MFHFYTRYIFGTLGNDDYDKEMYNKLTSAINKNHTVNKEDLRYVIGELSVTMKHNSKSTEQKEQLYDTLVDFIVNLMQYKSDYWATFSSTGNDTGLSNGEHFESNWYMMVDDDFRFNPKVGNKLYKNWRDKKIEGLREDYESLNIQSSLVDNTKLVKDVKLFIDMLFEFKCFI